MINLSWFDFKTFPFVSFGGCGGCALRLRDDRRGLDKPSIDVCMRWRKLAA